MELREMIRQIWPDWELVQKIDEGSFGTVYMAKREDFVGVSYSAIKVIVIPKGGGEIAALQAEGLGAAETRTYLENIVRDYTNEIKMLESVKGYTNIVAIEDYKVWEHQDEPRWHIFIRMELLTSLMNRIRSDGPLSEVEIAKVGIDLCRALEVCARHNIVHRDIKPENIFVNANGDYKLGDFGIARSLERLTIDMTRSGTPNYMAPELYKGTLRETSFEQAQLLDIYSVGMVLYWLSNGQRMPLLPAGKQIMSLEDKQMALRRRMDGEALPPPKYVHSALADVILKASAYRAEDRYQSAKELRRAIQNAIRDEDDNSVSGRGGKTLDEAQRAKSEQKESAQVDTKQTNETVKETDKTVTIQIIQGGVQKKNGTGLGAKRLSNVPVAVSDSHNPYNKRFSVNWRVPTTSEWFIGISIVLILIFGILFATHGFQDKTTGESAIQVFAIAPVISKQPHNTSAVAGIQVKLSATVEYATSYQWQYQMDENGFWYNLSVACNWTSGYYTNELVIEQSAERANYRYRLVAKNNAGETVSNSVQVSLLGQ